MNASTRRVFEVVDSEPKAGLRTRAERKKDFDWMDLRQAPRRSPNAAQPVAGLGAICLAIVCTIFVALVLGSMLNTAWHSLAEALHRAF